MKILEVCAGVLAAALVSSTAWAAENTNQIVGQWDFDRGDLSATVGQPMQYVGSVGARTSFATVPMGDLKANVMAFAAANPDEGYLVTHSAPGNGGGTNVNVYTLLMDIMYPSESDFSWRALLQTRPNTPENDADVFVNPINGIGINNQFHGQLLANTWYRIALVFDLPNDRFEKYVNGTLVGSQSLATRVDGPWSLPPSFYLFTDNDGETAPGFVNSIQFRTEALTAEAIAELAGPTPSGLPGPGGAEITLEIARVGAEAVITVRGSRSVQLQKKSDLNAANWTPVQATLTSSNTFNIPISEAHAFFQVQRVP